MTQKDELDLILKLIRKYNLPLSPILEYTIHEKCELLEENSMAQELSSEDDVILRICEQVRLVVSGYKSALTFLVDYNPSIGLVVKNQRFVKLVENLSDAHNNESDIVFTHPIDWSTFEYGLTIATKFHETIFNAVGKYISRGSGVDVKIIFHGKVFEARIVNADCKGIKGDTIQLLYKGKNNTLGSYLKDTFPNIYNYIKKFKENNGGRKKCLLPSDFRKLLIFKHAEMSDSFNLLIDSCL